MNTAKKLSTICLEFVDSILIPSKIKMDDKNAPQPDKKSDDLVAGSGDTAKAADEVTKTEIQSESKTEKPVQEESNQESIESADPVKPLKDAKLTCTACKIDFYSKHDIFGHWNEKHKETRERIYKQYVWHGCPSNSGNWTNTHFASPLCRQ